MIIDTEQIVHVSSISAAGGMVDMELESPFPEIEEKMGHGVVLAVMFAENLIIVIGTVTEYEKVVPDPDLPEQDVFARLSVKGQTISISLNDAQNGI